MTGPVCAGCARRAQSPMAEPRVFAPDLCDACGLRLALSKLEGKIGILLCDRCAPLVNKPNPAPADPWATVREWLDRSAPYGACDSYTMLWDGEAFGLGYETQDGIQRVFADGRPVACPTIEALAAWVQCENQALP